MGAQRCSWPGKVSTPPPRYLLPTHHFRRVLAMQLKTSPLPDATLMIPVMPERQHRSSLLPVSCQPWGIKLVIKMPFWYGPQTHQEALGSRIAI